jgi:hypothetical protein
MSRYRVETTTVSTAPVDAVWERLADASSWSTWGQWDETTLDREGVPAPDGVAAIRRFRGRQTTVEEVVPSSRRSTDARGSRTSSGPVSRCVTTTPR